MGSGLPGGRAGDRAILTPLATATVAALLAVATHAPFDVPGTFALAGKAAATTATLTVTPEGPQRARLNLVERRAGAVVTAYDVDMTKRLHLIVVSDDFATFQHLHPSLARDGRFTLDVTVPKPGRYRVYADADPHGTGQQVFRFDVPFGGAPATPHLGFTGRTARAGPYAVTLGGTKLAAGTTTELSVEIRENGKPATDLQPYLGGAAHAVFLDAASLAYVHVHPVPAGERMAEMPAMAGMSGMAATLPDSAHVPAALTLHVTAPVAGTYKLWLQFRGGGRLWVAPFVLTAA